MLPTAWARIGKRLTEKIFQQPLDCANGIAERYRFLNSKIFQLTKMIPGKNFVNPR
jgi:hypothetical protein